MIDRDGFGHSQEVVRSASGHMGLATAGGGVKLKERVFQSVVQFHDGCLVSTAVAVVWSTKDGHHILIMAPVVALHDQLMGAGHQGEAVGVVEGFRDVLSEGVAGPSGGDAPPTTIIRVRPQQVTHRALMWDFLQAVQSSYVIQSVYGGRQTSVETEDLSVHQCGQRQVVEQVCEVLPDVGVAVLPQALVVEAVDLRDLP